MVRCVLHAEVIDQECLAALHAVMLEAGQPVDGAVELVFLGDAQYHLAHQFLGDGLEAVLSHFQA